MPHEPQTLARTQRGRVPPDNNVQARGPGRYRLEYSRIYASTRKDPHRFEADDDEAALKYVAKHLSIDYPFTVRKFRSTGARGVYCEGQAEPVFR